MSKKMSSSIEKTDINADEMPSGDMTTQKMSSGKMMATADMAGMAESEMPSGDMTTEKTSSSQTIMTAGLAGMAESEMPGGDMTTKKMSSGQTIMTAGLAGMAESVMPGGDMTGGDMTGAEVSGAKMSTKAKKVSMPDLEKLTKDKDFVPQTTELKKGSEGDDVVRLQRYLSAFGYTESPTRSVFGVTADKAAVYAPKTGVFDENTEEALKRFQKFNHLPVTGKLDKDTLDLMTRPRCGFPDTADFTLEGRKWTKTALTYGFNEFTPDLSQAQIRSAISQALSLWSSVTPLTFTEVPIGNNPDIVVRFVAGNHGDGSNFDGPGGVLAHGFYPPPNGGSLAGDTHFDEAETWTVNLPPSGIDLVTVAAHEFGHALGLAHSAVAGALMAPYYNGAHRNLENDDISGIRALYGAQSSGWASMGGVITSNIAIYRNADGRLEIFARGTDNAVWHKWQTAPNSGWSGWASLGGVITSDIAIYRNADGRMEIFVRGTNQAVWHRWQTAPSNGWN